MYSRCRHRPVHSCWRISTGNNFRSLCLENHKHICLTCFFSVTYATYMYSLSVKQKRIWSSDSYVCVCCRSLAFQLLLRLKSTGAFDVNRKTNYFCTMFFSPSSLLLFIRHPIFRSVFRGFFRRPASAHMTISFLEWAHISVGCRSAAIPNHPLSLNSVCSICDGVVFNAQFTGDQ